MPVGKEEKGHRVVTKSGKHSVEVNVKIRRAGDNSPVTSLTPHARSLTPNGSTTAFKQGSWGDFLNRSNAPPVDVKVSQAETRKPKKQSSTIGTQTEAAHPTHDETSNSAGNKDIVETITQLHQLCAKLKDEVTQVTLAKERMETDLLSLIHEKDLIISSYHKVRSPAPRIDAPPQIPQPVAASNSDLNRFRVVLRGVRSIISQELEEMKRRPGFPLPPQDLHLDKILHRLYPNNDEEVGGGDRNGNGSRRHVVSACSTPGSSIIEDFGDMEGSSTQYLNLPRQ